MKTLKRVIGISLLALTAMVSGLLLQCASDPAVVGDGGVLDTSGIGDFLAERGLVDGIGPSADAAPGGAQRTVYKGKTDANGDFEACAKKYSGDDPPLVTVWLSGSANMSNARVAKVGDVRITGAGCIEYDGNMVTADEHIRIAVLY